MKFKVLFILTGVIILHAIILTGVCLTGGCKSPSVLGPRPFIAAPPPEDEIIDEPITDIKDTIPKITMTTTRKITPKAMTAPPVFELGIPPQGIIYVVKKNDSFWKIAKNHGVTMRSLAAFNDMSLSKVLRVGEKLRIPPGGYVVKNIKSAAKARKVVRAKPQARPSDGVYLVKSGDSFWKIAKRYNLKTKTLLDANNMTGKETLQIGQELIIPDGKKSILATTAPATITPNTADDSLTSILDTVDSPDDSKNAPKAAKKLIEDIDDNSDDSDRAVQVIQDIKVADFAKQYKVTTAMLKQLNTDYPADGVFKAGSVVIVRSSE